MGRLLQVHPCPVCNYYVEDHLHEGGSGSAALFLTHHYILATCQDCANLVSVLVPNTADETTQAIYQARHQIVQLEADAAVGDLHAKEWLPFYRDALDTLAGFTEIVETTCTLCGSAHVSLTQFSGEEFDSPTAWIMCPSCHEGQLLLETAGQWE